MTLRKKSLSVIAATILVLFGFLILLAELILRPQARQYETVQIRRDMGRVLYMLDEELDKLSATNADYASWDDTYKFVQDEDSNYITQNLTTTTFQNNHVGFFVFMNTSGKIVCARGFDFDQKMRTSVSENFLRLLKPGTPFLNIKDSASYYKGILPLPESPLFVSAKPILTSLGQGPVNGILFAGRFLTEAEIKTLETLTQTTFSFEPCSGSENEKMAERIESTGINFVQSHRDDPERDTFDKISMLIEPIDRNTIGAFTLLHDPFNKPAYLLRVTMNRDYYRQFISNLNYFVSMFIITGILLLTIQYITLERQFFSRLIRLNRFLTGVRTTEKLTERFQREGNDEITELSESVNDMLEQLDRDLKARLAAEEESRLRQAQLLQAEKLASLGTLVSGVAHEINNPNHFILSNITPLNRAWTEAAPLMDAYYRENGDFVIAGMNYSQARDTIPTLFKDIHEGSLRIKRIVDELRDYAREQPATLTESVDINRALQAAVNLLTPLLHKNTQHFVMMPGEGIPAFKGNLQRIERVIINLLKNACESLTDSAQGVEVSTCYDTAARQIILRVKDQGAGIREEDLPRLTTPFYTTKSAGLGIGLSICAEIVREHSGTLEFDSVPGEGTTVTLKIPAPGLPNQKTHP